MTAESGSVSTTVTAQSGESHTDVTQITFSSQLQLFLRRKCTITVHPFMCVLVLFNLSHVHIGCRHHYFHFH